MRDAIEVEVAEATETKKKRRMNKCWKFEKIALGFHKICGQAIFYCIC